MPCSGEQPEHPATVSSFALDKYEVTVGRFRAFVKAGGGTQQRPPVVGAATHPKIAGTGWRSEWNTYLPPDTSTLTEELKDSCTDNWDVYTWTDEPGANESYPIYCVSWVEVFAFCAWDGGRLPTEAEWEYASAGGDRNNLYPWGNDAREPLPAVYASNITSAFTPVGSCPAGDARWGHADLAGSAAEMVFDAISEDWYAKTSAGCVDCANVEGLARRCRGGDWGTEATVLRAAAQFHGVDLDMHMLYVGFRCARNP